MMREYMGGYGWCNHVVWVSRRCLGVMRVSVWCVNFILMSGYCSGVRTRTCAREGGTVERERMRLRAYGRDGEIKSEGMWLRG